MNRNPPDAHRQQLAELFRQATFGPDGPPDDVDEATVLRLFRDWCGWMYYSGPPGFRRLIERVAEECEQHLVNDPTWAVAWRQGPGGRLIRQWRQPGRLGPTPVADTN